jgi:hypothetical protein
MKKVGSSFERMRMSLIIGSKKRVFFLRRTNLIAKGENPTFK